jgi:hypothetical protein
MEDKIQENNTEISWEIPEFEKHERSKKWYVIAGVITILILLFALITSNFLFAVIIIIATLIIIIHDGKEADLVNIIIDEDGVVVGRKFYDYDVLKNFSVLFKPKEDLKNLYFEFKNSAKQRLSIPLLDNNPLQVRDFLLKYLSEDLDRTNMPLSENISKLLKI